MPRPTPKLITFTIDGREVEAPENAMLVDAAKYGDVEIPVFCYEPKLGQPVGACRMCLVEVEGIPKLQAGCATPVKDGMVVHTQSDKVKAAQESVVEFLLINHPLDCPVCDKGGECPLQDISFGWGRGDSRFVEPKRHFQKPLELSPLIAIDRERCILCYRCVRFSQEISEDYQLIFTERGADTYVGTFDGHPYVAPFSGNIIELCPVGALTSRPYRFRARPWDIEQSGSVCTLCPAQCNVSFTVRDERVLRVLARQNDEVDDGWLCDKGRFAYQAVHSDERITAPMIRDGGFLREVTWERALEEAAAALGRAKGRVGALAGGEATNEEGFLLQRLVREGLGSNDLDATTGIPPRALQRALDPKLAARLSDLEFAHTVLVLGVEPVDAMAIADLRIRKGVRRRRVNLVVATSRPSSLDPNAGTVLRYAPGEEAAVLRELAAGETDAAKALRAAGEEIVVLFGSDLLATAADELLALADALDLAGVDGAGLIAVPAGANGRGLVEAGVAPGTGPGFADAPAGRDAAAIGDALAAGELTALYLLQADPLAEQPRRGVWEQALERATTVVAHASYLTETIREHANIVFPAQSYAEKEGTLVHPDGRVQRLRPAIGSPADVRPAWSVLAELAKRLGLDMGILTGSMASAQLFAAVPFYAGLTLDAIGGSGIRWPGSDAASAFPAAPAAAAPAAAAPTAPRATAASDGHLRLGTFRSIWAAPEVAASPALRFLHPEQTAELSPLDADRLGLRHGDRVKVGTNGHSVHARVVLRDAVPAGAVFLQEGIPADAANNLDGPLVEVSKA